MRPPTLICNAAWLWLAVAGQAQDKVIRLSGEVFHKQEYRREVGHGLVFVLEPADTGWTIRVVPKTACLTVGDWAWVVNPPYRNYNSLHVDASYDITATEAVTNFNPREFLFVTTCADYKIEAHRLEMIFWPGATPPHEVSEALKLPPSRVARAKFTILKSKVSRAPEDIEGKNYGTIDWLKFTVIGMFP